MKNLKKTVAILGTLGIIASSTAVYAAATAKTPADIVSGLTGKTTTQLYTERAAGKTYGTIAKEAGKLTEFQKQMLAEKKVVLDQRVKDKTLTQSQADAIYNAMKTNQATCDGTGSAAIGKKNGVGFGQGQGQGKGMGMGKGSGNGMRNSSGNGAGCGMGCRLGSK
jgi:hypothetical protein